MKERAILRHEPATFTSEILDRVVRTSRATPDRTAYSDARSGHAVSYSELWRRAREASSHLRDRAPAPGPAILRVGNTIEFAVWFLALLASDVAAFPVAPSVPHAEVERLAQQSAAGTLVSLVNGTVTIGPPPTDGGGNQHSSIAESNASIVPSARPSTHAAPPRSGLLLVSSGTTSIPKIVHRSVESLDAVARNTAEAIGLRDQDRVLAAVPLTHSYGLEHGLLAPLWAGASVMLTDGAALGSIDPGSAAEVTILPAVPAMIEMLCAATSPVEAMRSLRLVYSAGAPLPESVRERFLSRFSQPIGQVYGMTEVGSVTFNDPHEPRFDPSTVGQPMRDVSLRIVHPDSRDAEPDGTEGELLVRAPSMLSRYLGEPTPIEHGHFTSGDLGRVDEHGRLTITGRRRLLIDTGGLKVNPLEVEAVLCSHPGVTECVVVPMRQSSTVDRLRAIVVPRDPSAPPSEQSLRAFARQRLAAGKVPRRIELAHSLPRTASGKVQRDGLETL